MSQKPRIGQYRHVPGSYIGGAGQAPRPVRVRRRFPQMAVVFLVYGLCGPMACAAVPWLFKATGNARLLPTTLSELPMPPSPSLRNVMFGAGLQETALACALTGYLLFRILWNQRQPEERQKQGIFGVLPSLLGQGLVLGPVFAFLGLPFGMYGLYLRAGPVDQPLPVRALFGILAAFITSVAAVFTVVIPLVLLLLGVLMGVGTAVAVAWLWQHYPEEPVLK